MPIDDPAYAPRPVMLIRFEDANLRRSAILGPFHVVKLLGNRLRAEYHGRSGVTRCTAHYRESFAGWEVIDADCWPIYDRDDNDEPLTVAGKPWAGIEIWTI